MVDVLTNINSTFDINNFNLSYVQLYTKEGIDALINPTMKFKGVLSAADIDQMSLTASNVGESYKLSTNGSNSLTTEDLRTARIGDLAIVCQGTTQDNITNESIPYYYWAIVPSGDESVVDTYRPIAINNTKEIGENTLSGYLNFKDGNGITVTATH
jgi:hypothetical protein